MPNVKSTRDDRDMSPVVDLLDCSRGGFVEVSGGGVAGNTPHKYKVELSLDQGRSGAEWRALLCRAFLHVLRVPPWTD